MCYQCGVSHNRDDCPTNRSRVVTPEQHSEDSRFLRLVADDREREIKRLNRHNGHLQRRLAYWEMGAFGMLVAALVVTVWVCR